MNITPYIMFGNKILDSTLGQGIKQLIGDAVGAAQIVGGIAIVFMFIWVSVKKSRESEDEQERKRYGKAQIALIVIEVLIWVAVPLINLILSYFGVAPISV